MKKHLVLFLIAAMVTVFSAASAFADEVRLNGATTVIDRLVTPHKDAVEKKTGHKLEIVGNGTGKGLVDLHEGRIGRLSFHDVGQVSQGFLRG